MGQCRTGRVMKSSIFLLVLASATAAPQFEGLKDIFSALSGDDEAGEVNGDYEQVPYTTLKQFDGYEMRQYPSVKCPARRRPTRWRRRTPSPGTPTTST